MCPQATLALTTCLGACLGVNRPQLKRLFGAWGVTLSFRRERFSFLDFNFVAAESLPSRKPCKLSGPLLDELVLVSVLAPLYLPDLRSHTLSELFAFDAFDSRAGGCGAPRQGGSMVVLVRLVRGVERTRALRLGVSPPNPAFSDTRAGAAWNALSLP